LGGEWLTAQAGSRKVRKKSGKVLVDAWTPWQVSELGRRAPACFLFLNLCGFRWGVQLGPLEAVIESRVEKSIGRKKLNCLSDPETPYFHPFIQSAILSALWLLVKSLFLVENHVLLPAKKLKYKSNGIITVCSTYLALPNPLAFATLTRVTI
jgi:hypothetical protein